MTSLGEVARRAAATGAEVARTWHARVGDLDVHEKTGPRDLVSRADVETERAIRAVLHERRPGDTVTGEEEGTTGGAGGLEWLVDPIDGTTSFLYGRSDWAVSVAVREPTGELAAAAVAEPALDRLTWACRGGGTWVDGRRVRMRSTPALADALVEVNFGRPADQHPRAGSMVDTLLPRVRDLRRGGSAAVSLTTLATGGADVVWSPGLQHWDGAAGVLLVREAGGVVGGLTGPSGNRWPEGGDVLATSPDLWDSCCRLLSQVYADAGVGKPMTP